MMNIFVLYALGHGIGERYWTGKLGNNNEPIMTDILQRARAFESARDGYDYAGKRIILCRVLRHFHVGRRPCPVDLRSANVHRFN